MPQWQKMWQEKATLYNAGGDSILMLWNFAQKQTFLCLINKSKNVNIAAASFLYRLIERKKTTPNAVKVILWMWKIKFDFLYKKFCHRKLIFCSFVSLLAHRFIVEHQCFEVMCNCIFRLIFSVFYCFWNVEPKDPKYIHLQSQSSMCLTLGL